MPKITSLNVFACISKYQLYIATAYDETAVYLYCFILINCNKPDDKSVEIKTKSIFLSTILNITSNWQKVTRNEYKATKKDKSNK